MTQDKLTEDNILHKQEGLEAQIADDLCKDAVQKYGRALLHLQELGAAPQAVYRTYLYTTLINMTGFSAFGDEPLVRRRRKKGKSDPSGIENAMRAMGMTIVKWLEDEGVPGVHTINERVIMNSMPTEEIFRYLSTLKIYDGEKFTRRA